MDYNELLNKLIEQVREKINKDKYEKYISIQNKLLSILEDHQKVFDITEDELELIDDNQFINILKFLKIMLSHNHEIDKDEIDSFINAAIEKTKVNFENDEEVKLYKERNKKLDDIYNVIVNNFDDKEELVFSFIMECYENNMIDIENTIKLIFYVTSVKTDKMPLDVNNDVEEIDEVIITENGTNISDDLIKLFEKYGYDYNKLDDNIRKNLEKYGKLNYSEEIIKFLKKYNLSENDFMSHQGIISKLMVFQDKTALDKIDEFIYNNACTLPRLLSFGAIFFHRTKKFKFRDKNDDIIIPPRNGFYAPCGQFEGFLYCVELYKKAKNLPDDYKMTDDDFLKDNKVSMIRFFTTPKEKIEKNLLLLRKYGYIDGNELPNALVALTGRNTEYLMDRLIESGLHRYGKDNASILTLNDFPFRWYKIKRARDLNESLFSRNGLKSELKSDNKSYMGITWHINNKKQVIDQSSMEMGDLVRGGRALPKYKRIKMLPYIKDEEVRNDSLPYEVAYREFKHFYEYLVYDPNTIYKYNPSGVPSTEMGLLVSAIFNLDYSDSVNDTIADNDYYVKLLDEKYMVDNLTYNFNRIGTGIWPNVNILISRPKVIRLISLLQQKNAWIDEKLSMLDKENLLLSVVVKDTILSRNDFNMMRMMIHDLVVIEYKNISVKGRGIE